MANVTGDIVMCSLIAITFIILFGSTELIKAFSGSEVIYSNNSYSWVIRLCLNLLGYGTIILPGWLIYNYARYTKYLQRGSGCMHQLVRSCFVGTGDTGILDSPMYTTANAGRAPKPFVYEFLLLLYCFLGLQISYLTWGFFQEKIMTQDYIDVDGNKEKFKDSQFLVLINRILAFVMSGTYLLFRKQSTHTTPLYKYVFCSLSNIMSSWCQYEALKYVSFPMQVMAKATKIIPVMLMGKLISKSTYEYYEYFTAVLISIGMTLFMLTSDSHKTDSATTFSGLLLLTGYIVLDSFTSNWQNALFNEYGATSVQMMCAVNMFSCLLTATSLFQQSSFAQSLMFMSTYPQFIIDCLFISISSAAGQLFIFYTISKFGAVTFAIIMTIRQGLAVLLSCVMYQHKITLIGAFGVLIVFGSVFLRIYCNNRLRAIRRRRAEASIVKD